MSKKIELIRAPNQIFETHCHLDYLADPPATIIQTCLDQNVSKLLTIAVERKNQNIALSLAQKHNEVYCTQGIHPHHANEWDEQLKETIISNCMDKNVAAIGEIGLDYYYNHSPPSVQRAVFEEQLAIAIELNLPVIVHTRDAEDDTIKILDKYKFSQGVIIHCFTSNIDLAKYALQRHFFLGFNGIVTFKNAHNVREALDITPIEQIVLETDAPFLAPLPFRGRENTPAYLPFISRAIAEYKKVSEEKLLEVVYNNSVHLLLNR